MKYLRIILIDSNPLVINAWSKQLRSTESYLSSKYSLSLSIETHQGLLCDLPVETNKRTAIVSPANSVGGMGGGFDEALCDLFSPKNDLGKDEVIKSVESWVKKFIHHGYTPLGSAHVVEFYNCPGFSNSKAWRTLNASSIVVVPTMRVPKSLYTLEGCETQAVLDSKNQSIVAFIFDCIWEALSAVDRHNIKYDLEAHKDSEIAGRIDTLVIPGLGTGYGNLPIDLVSKGMIGALNIWGLQLRENNEKHAHRGLLCLKFLGEDYRMFESQDVLETCMGIFKKNTEFNILHQNVGDFYSTLVE